MFDLDLTHRWSNFLLRTHGPFSFRFILQPIMGALLGIRAGIRDARLEKHPYFWWMIKHREHRIESIKNGWKDVVRLFILAAVLDMLVHWLMFKWIYPLEALLVGFFLAVPSYLLFRGPTTRIVQLRNRKKPRDERKRAA